MTLVNDLDQARANELWQAYQRAHIWRSRAEVARAADALIGWLSIPTRPVPSEELRGRAFGQLTRPQLLAMLRDVRHAAEML